MPTEMNVPTAAISRPSATRVRCASAAPVMVMVLEMNPLNTGMPEMDRAATMYSTITHGSRAARPPSLSSLAVPAACSRQPAPMNSRPLYRMCA